jgi:hypothetical protein
MTALQVAEASNVNGSHNETVNLLRGWDLVVAAEGALALERQDEADACLKMEAEEALSLVNKRGGGVSLVRVGKEEGGVTSLY